MNNEKTFVLTWVEAYEKSLGVKHVASKMGVTPQSVSMKANMLRKRGVNLPAMRWQRNGKYATEELNALIEQRIN